MVTRMGDNAARVVTWKSIYQVNKYIRNLKHLYHGWEEVQGKFCKEGSEHPRVLSLWRFMLASHKKNTTEVVS